MSLADHRPRWPYRREESDEAGVSAMELVVAMLIFSVVISVYFGALISMAGTTAKAQNSVDASDALRATFNAMDHQVRYATAINRPVQGSSGIWYVEFESTMLPNNAPALCHQWRLDPVAKVLSYRTWREDGITVSPWRGVAWDVDSTSAGSPFVFTPVTSTVVAQTLTVSLQFKAPDGRIVAEQSTTFIARNSSTKSLSNADDDGDGVSDDEVCTSRMDRP